MLSIIIINAMLAIIIDAAFLVKKYPVSVAFLHRLDFVTTFSLVFPSLDK